MKHCILNVADGEFSRPQTRLRDSLRSIGYQGDLLFWTDEFPPGSPTQDAAPMAFKVAAFHYARRRGYGAALWLDAAMIAIRDLTSLFRIVQKRGVYLWGTGAVCGEWSSDIILDRCEVAREESFGIEEVVSCVVGVSFGHPAGDCFLKEWTRLAFDGESFRGVPSHLPWTVSRGNAGAVVSKDPRVRGHRWDQTAASLVAYKQRIPVSHMECMDIVDYRETGWTYARTIPLTVRLLQNRDFKAGMFRTFTRASAPLGPGRIPQLIRDLVKTLKLALKSMFIRIKFHALSLRRRF